jgi:aromatic ring hydroxylase
MKAVRETDGGIFVSGARSVATLGPFANEILILPSLVRVPLVADAESYILGFAVPVATAGVRLICRPSLAAQSGRVLDHPLSARMDEMDAVVWFDNAFVPWERVFLYRNLDAAASIRKVGSGHTMHQSGTKTLAKSEFLLGIALAVAETNRGDTQPQILNLLAEMISTVEMVRGLLVASEAECLPGPSGTVVPNDQPLSVIRLMFPSLHARMVEILHLICSGNLVLTPAIDELSGDAADAVAVYCAGADGLPAARKIELLRLAWDASCSGFAGRQVLYERFFSGDPWRNAVTRTQGYARAGELKQRIWQFLERTEAWDRELTPPV